MPNHCTNIVKASKEVLENLFDGKNITFQKLIPMPKSLNITEGSITSDAIIYVMNKKATNDFFSFKKMLEDISDNYYINLWNKYKDKFSIEKIKQLEKKAYTYIPSDTEKELGIKTLEDFGNLCLENIKKYNCVSWYDWSIKNWGTKWDAYECSGTPEEGKLTFLTAWSPPYKIMEALFKKCSKSEIEWYYEGGGNEYKGKMYSDGEGNVINEEEEFSQEDRENEGEEI